MPVPADATGAVFIRRQDTQVHFDDRGQLLYNGYRIKILHPNALQLGNLTIVWNPAAGAPMVHSIKIHRDGEVIDVLESSSFEILRREDQLEAARLDGNLTAVLRVPDLRVGDELEFAATIRSSDPTLGKSDAGMLALQAEPAPGRYHLRLSWKDGDKPTVKMSPDMVPFARQDASAIDYRFDNPSALTPPKDAPPRYQWQRVVEYSSFGDWQSISRRFAPLFAGASRLPADSPLKREAARISAASAQPLERAGAALKLVQQNIRYIYVGLNGGNLTPASADETWQRRYGDCKAKTVLLLALLKELGINAEAVLVNNGGNDDGMDERLPSPRMFDHVLVRARIGGKVYWLDGTLPSVVSPGSAPVIPYEWVLPLAEKGASLEHLNWSPARRPDEVTLFEIDARAGFDKPARITNTTIKRGVEGLQQEVQFSVATPAQLLTAFRQQAIGDTWQTIEDVQWHYDQKAQASVLTVIGTGTVDWDDDGDGVRSMALPGGGFNPPEKRIRAAEQNQDLPFYSKPIFDCRVTTVRLPATTKPTQWSHKPAIDTRIFGRSYYRAFDIRDGAMRMVRGLRTEEREIAAVTALRDNTRIPRFDNSMAWITYTPGSTNTIDPKSKPVPATYEIDWTADNVPCLPADLLTNEQAD
ncbi:transglutaminase [Novosphingobium guangzhouense]|uniref:Transglutaminase n=2 Tax=Novosphingobium guangzhouense TaxID=1850347 RepID=A0A2K2G7A8_9SPHN|nr:transglutaminase [Novosphingobium guangzhouense]